VIAVVDYGLGNLGSVTKAFRACGAEIVLSDDPGTLRAADALVLPGDGAFGATMEEIRRRGLEPLLRERAAAGLPLLGICIGMQVLFDESEEHGRHPGLGLLRGRVRSLFDEGQHAELSVPHMGWNRLRQQQTHALFSGVAEGAHVYFVHSYRCEAQAEDLLASSDYGVDVAAVVARDNVFGMQFHPEKSQAVGLRLIANFVRLVTEARHAAAHGARALPGQQARRPEPQPQPAHAAGVTPARE
jgi:imidazole glycerol-phosphate synthase subunit HisH